MKGLILSGSRVVNSDEGEDEDEEREQSISNWRVPLCPPSALCRNNMVGWRVEVCCLRPDFPVLTSLAFWSQ